MALPATFPVARANVLIAGLRTREVNGLFLFVDRRDWSEGFARHQRHVVVTPTRVPSRKPACGRESI
jgi:hypothetical protein